MMFDPEFIRRQNRLYRLKQLLTLSCHVLIAGALIGFGFWSVALIDVPAIENNGIPVTGQDPDIYLNVALVSLICLIATKFILKHMLRTRLWEAYAHKNSVTQPNYSPTAAAPAGPVVTYGSISTDSQIQIDSIENGYAVHISDASYRYTFARSEGFDVRYLILSTPINVRTPHIFIDGKIQNRFGRSSRDMWSLTKKLSRRDKLQDLEGDFYKFFDVYSADKEYLSTLSILAPDSMLVLRDQGYSFDYEIYDGTLYVIRDFELFTVRDFEAFHAAVAACLKGLVPQIAKQRYDGPGTKLTTGTAPMRFWAMLYTFRIFGIGSGLV